MLCSRRVASPGPDAADKISATEGITRPGIPPSKESEFKRVGLLADGLNVTAGALSVICIGGRNPQGKCNINLASARADDYNASLISSFPEVFVVSPPCVFVRIITALLGTGVPPHGFSRGFLLTHGQCWYHMSGHPGAAVCSSSDQAARSWGISPRWLPSKRSTSSMLAPSFGLSEAGWH